MDNLAYQDEYEADKPRHIRWMGSRKPYINRLKEPLYIPHYTYKDFKLWPEDLRCELIDGQVYMMAAPTSFHQGLQTEIVGTFYQFLLGKPCRVYGSPYEVRLFQTADPDKVNEDDDTIVEPDMAVVCDKSKRFKEGCHGAPDLVLEILSPSSKKMDIELKKQRYLDAGVREYWMLDPDTRSLEVCLLSGSGQNRSYTSQTYTEDKTVKVAIFNGALSINLDEIFKRAEEY
jgi:Uma2 family endonuclease